MSLYKPYTSRSDEKRTQEFPVTEFDILKASHKFLRDDAGQPGSSSTNIASSSSSSWNDQLAKKYYDTLFREFALCNLKHYKSGNFALRWRTENEVLDGTGETTCGNMRCEYHRPHSTSNSLPRLTTLELPFAYEEHGELKQALVKVVLCPGCVKKLMWKRNREKRMLAKGKGVEERNDDIHDTGGEKGHDSDGDEDGSDPGGDSGPEERRRNSRSRPRSPRSHDRKRSRREDSGERKSRRSRKRLREHGGGNDVS